MRRELGVGELHERGSAPERLGLDESGVGGAGVAGVERGPTLVGESPEAKVVDVRRVDPEAVAVVVEHQRLRSRGGGAGGTRCCGGCPPPTPGGSSPQSSVDERVDADAATVGDQEHGDHETGLTPAQIEGAPFVIEHLQGPEDTESHR